MVYFCYQCDLPFESLNIVVDIIKVPFQLVLGEKVGSVLQKVSHDPLQYLMAWWLAISLHNLVLCSVHPYNQLDKKQDYLPLIRILQFGKSSKGDNSLMFPVNYLPLPS
jgi:hypothetical protein